MKKRLRPLFSREACAFSAIAPRARSLMKKLLAKKRARLTMLPEPGLGETLSVAKPQRLRPPWELQLLPCHPPPPRLFPRDPPPRLLLLPLGRDDS